MAYTPPSYTATNFFSNTLTTNPSNDYVAPVYTNVNFDMYGVVTTLMFQNYINTSSQITNGITNQSTLQFAESINASTSLYQYFEFKFQENVKITPNLIGNFTYNLFFRDNVNVSSSLSTTKTITLLFEETVDIDASVHSNATYIAKFAENININSILIGYDGDGNVLGEFDTWVSNYETDAYSRYTGFNFNSYAKINDKYYGSGVNGLAIIDGETDNGTVPSQKIITGMLHFDDHRKTSRLFHVDLFVMNDNSMNLVIKDNMGQQYTYTQTQVNEDYTPTRFKTGKGFKGTYYTFEINNNNTTNFDLDAVAIYRLNTTRLTK